MLHLAALVCQVQHHFLIENGDDYQGEKELYFSKTISSCKTNECGSVCLREETSLLFRESVSEESNALEKIPSISISVDVNGSKIGHKEYSSAINNKKKTGNTDVSNSHKNVSGDSHEGFSEIDSGCEGSVSVRSSILSLNERDSDSDTTLVDDAETRELLYSSLIEIDSLPDNSADTGEMIC